MAKIIFSCVHLFLLWSAMEMKLWKVLRSMVLLHLAAQLSAQLSSRGRKPAWFWSRISRRTVPNDIICSSIICSRVNVRRLLYCWRCEAVCAAVPRPKRKSQMYARPCSGQYDHCLPPAWVGVVGVLRQPFLRWPQLPANLCPTPDVKIDHITRACCVFLLCLPGIL